MTSCSKEWFGFFVHQTNCKVIFNQLNIKTEIQLEDFSCFSLYEIALVVFVNADFQYVYDVCIFDAFMGIT